jgi:hypothetical protein
MSRWNRDPDEIRLDIAYATGEGLDVIEHLRGRHEAAGWTERAER